MQNFKDSRQADYRIAPSILSADFARLGEEVDAVLAAGADMIHFDVMDNHYVPNLTIGPMVCKALRKYGVTAPIDVHLMVEPVDDLIGQFADAGATFITFHPEASRHVDRSLQLIKDRGCFAGLVLNPASSLDEIKYVMAKMDMLLLMSVNPGFGGQQFIPYVLDKVREARALIDASGYNIRLEVDGGVSTARPFLTPTITPRPLRPCVRNWHWPIRVKPVAAVGVIPGRLSKVTG
jgi:ribulose-phosphate 3-epimerase